MIWYIRRAERTGTINDYRFLLKNKPVMGREENPEKFDRLISGWWKLCLLIPFITFGVIYFRGFE